MKGGGDHPFLPGLNASDVFQATARFWDTSGVAPVPTGDWLKCPICQSAVQVRWWRWHERPQGHTIRYRCDVSIKCAGCAAVWLHGVALDVKAWARRPFPREDRREVKWRRVRPLL